MSNHADNAARTGGGAALPVARRLSGDNLVLIVVCIAQFMVVLDVSIVNVALPSIRTDLHMSSSSLQWIINAYTLTFAGFLLLGGRAADLFGRRRLFLAGLVLFSSMSLLGGLAQNGTELIAARALQGFGGAVLSPATLTILTATFIEPKARTRALGVWSAVAAGGGAAGVLLGGVLTSVSWRWILFINVPIGIATAVVARLALKESRLESERPTLDWLGALTVTGGLSAVVYGIVSTDTHSWGSAATLIPIAVGVLLLALFVYVEQRHPHPLVRLSLFTNRAVAGSNLIMVMIGSAMFGVFYFLSLFLQNVEHYSALRTGFAFFPLPVAIMVGTQVSSRLVARLGTRILLVAGTLTATVGLFLVSRITVDSSYLLHVGLPGALFTLGIGISFVPVTLAATSSVPRKDAGLASGLINTTRQIGGSVGLAVLATLATSRTASKASEGTRAALTAGYSRALLTGSGFLLIAVVIALVVLPRRIKPVDTPATGVAEEGLPVLETA